MCVIARYQRNLEKSRIEKTCKDDGTRTGNMQDVWAVAFDDAWQNSSNIKGHPQLVIKGNFDALAVGDCSA